jgi:SAM-dependent methyltransferase
MSQWERGRGYWEQAGKAGYGEKMYASQDVESHIRGRLWQMMIDIADAMGIQESASVLDLGCGDGQFTNQMLAPKYRQVHGIDFAEPAIERAKRESPGPHTTFAARDITTMDYTTLGRYDAIFLVGILHHVKLATPGIVKALQGVSDRVIMLEPNGAHPLRKLLELTPSYRAAGEDSFTAGQLKRIFADAGYSVHTHKRANLLPNFTPKGVFNLLVPLEQTVENTPFLSPMCTVNLFGFDTAPKVVN